MISRNLKVPTNIVKVTWRVPSEGFPRWKEVPPSQLTYLSLTIPMLKHICSYSFLGIQPYLYFFLGRHHALRLVYPLFEQIISLYRKYFAGWIIQGVARCKWVSHVKRSARLTSSLAQYSISTHPAVFRLHAIRPYHSGSMLYYFMVLSTTQMD